MLYTNEKGQYEIETIIPSRYPVPPNLPGLEKYAGLTRPAHSSARGEGPKGLDRTSFLEYFILMNDKSMIEPAALLGAQIRRLRKCKRLSLSELAGFAGTSPSALHRYESGWERFEVRTLRRVATALEARLVVWLQPLRDTAASPPETATQLVVRWRPLFWDVDLEALHLEENPQWVLRRVLAFGDWEDVHQARLFLGDDAVRRAAEHRSVDVRTRRFWQLVLGPAVG